METELLTINIEGTEFIIDVLKQELREKAAPENNLPIQNMLYVGSGYRFQYDTINKNIASFEATGDFSNSNRIKEIKIPNLVELDPAGMAKRYNLTIDKVREKTDFELMIRPGSLLDLRWNKKVLPILKIAGHIFFIDIAMNKLRPKDDFKSKGISLEEITNYYDRIAQAYIIPYNPKTHELQEVDHFTITELPKEIIVVKFPHLQQLDRVGWNVKYGFGPGYQITENHFQLHFNARTLPWKETNIPNSIKLNREAQLLEEKKTVLSEKQPDMESKVKKGRTM